MESFKKHIPAFAALLSNIDPTSISAGAYPQQYLKDLLLHKIHYLSLYASVLDRAFEATDKTPDETCLLDFGCGNGLLALFAKFCGVKEVHASDMNAPFLLAAQQLSKALNIELSGWLIGNENTLIEYFDGKQLDVLVGTDVIEHVYSLDNLFRVIKQLNPQMGTVFTTASVAENPFKSRQLKKLMIQDELAGSNKFHSTYTGEFAGLPFLTIRNKLIAKKYPSLTESEVKELAIASRGLAADDIYKDVEEYLISKKFPSPIHHSFNTCDPITGSWTERLLTTKEYEQLYKRYQFSVQIHNGFYNEFETGLKSKLSLLLNKAIDLLGKKAITISPFIFLVGRKD